MHERFIWMNSDITDIKVTPKSGSVAISNQKDARDTTYLIMFWNVTSKQADTLQWVLNLHVALS